MIADPGARLLSSYIFAAKYANHLADQKRRETEAEAQARVFGMHRAFYADKITSSSGEYAGVLASSIDGAEAVYEEGSILGSQRALQFGGRAMLRKHARGYNCCASFADRPRFFAEAFWLLLCGCGVGFSAQRHHVARLPDLRAPASSSSGRETVFVVPDTIEGWADALDVLIGSYFAGGPRVVFDYSLVRPRGAFLSTGTGRAPGPEPLRQALEDVRRLLDECVARGSRLRPIDVYDVVMYASQAVLSGGVRRSATICVFSPDDEEMIAAKTGDWFTTNSQRARSNNSAVLLRGRTPFATFRRLVDAAREYGEPGVFWTHSTEIVPNPCVEVGFYPVDESTGATGWHFCNLSTINVATCPSVEEFVRRARAAATLGTLQAGYTDLAYLGPVSERIMRREALLGVSMTGMQQNRDLAFAPRILNMGMDAVLETNAYLAPLLGIRLAARAAALKPEGTGSCYRGTTPGIGRAKGRREIRRVQANELEAHALAFQAANPHAVELSRRTGDGNTRDLILSFALEWPESTGVESESTALEALAEVRLVKREWVDRGRRADLCTHPHVSNNVSNTITVRDNEWDEVAHEIYSHQDDYAGVSLLRHDGDQVYEQAPFTAVDGPGDRTAVAEEWERLRRLTVPVDFGSVTEETNGTNFGAESACAGGACLI